MGGYGVGGYGFGEYGTGGVYSPTPANFLDVHHRADGTTTIVHRPKS